MATRQVFVFGLPGLSIGVAGTIDAGFENARSMPASQRQRCQFYIHAAELQV